MKPYEQGLKNDDGGWGNAVASTSCDYIEFWIKDGIIYYKCESAVENIFRFLI